MGLSGLVAPFEGDGQLALMARQRQVSFVLTPDSDLIVHGCAHVLITPIGGDDRLHFNTGDIVYSFPVEKMSSDLVETRQMLEECERLVATGSKPPLAGEDDQGKWMGACLAKHGIPGLRLRACAVLLGSDYSAGGYPNVGMAKLLPVLLHAGPTVDAVFTALEAKYPHPAAFVPTSAPPAGLTQVISELLKTDPTAGLAKAKAAANSWNSGQQRRRRGGRGSISDSTIRDALKVAKAALSPTRDELLQTFQDAERIYKHSLAYGQSVRSELIT